MIYMVFWGGKFIFDVCLMILLRSDFQFQSGDGDHLENRIFNSF